MQPQPSHNGVTNGRLLQTESTTPQTSENSAGAARVLDGCCKFAYNSLGGLVSIVAAVSVVVMPILAKAKRRVAAGLGSAMAFAE